MVDRYLLPIPKTKNLRMYMRLKNKPMWALSYVAGILLLTCQVNRMNALRTVN
jgi:hypothetical protein